MTKKTDGILGIAGLSVREYAVSANADLGIRDSGKTYTATKAAEELLDAAPPVPFLALDPIGVWHAMRIPGRGKGYPVVVAGGKYGDVPLTPMNAGTIVRAAMQSGVSLVLDLFSKELSKADWRRIVRETCEILLHENESLRHVFIEEAGEFVPQKVRDGHVFAAVESLVRLGGNSKVGCTLINQRSADLNKSVLELCGTVLVHRQTGKNTLLDLRKWIGVLGLDDDQQAKIASTLPDLKSGTCWVFSTQLKAPVLLKVAAKNSKHPDRREESLAVEAEKARASMDKGDFLAVLEKLLAPKAAKAKPQPVTLTVHPLPPAQDARVKKQIAADLERYRDEGRQEVLAKIPDMLDAQHASSFVAGAESTMGSFTKFFSGQLTALQSTPEAIPQRKPVAAIQKLLKQRGGTGSFSLTGPVSAAAFQKDGPVMFSVHDTQTGRSEAGRGTLTGGTLTRDKVEVSHDGLTGPQRTLMAALAWWLALGHSAVSRAQLAAKARWKVKGSNLRNRLSELSQAGLVEYPETGKVALTLRGQEIAPEPVTGDTLVGSIQAMLTGPQLAVFDALRQTDQVVSRDQLADALGWERGGSNLRNRLSELSQMELVVYPQKGTVELSDWVTG